MKKIFTFLFFTVCFFAAKTTFGQTYPTIYAYKAGISGSWATGANWESYTGNASNTPVTLTATQSGSVPSGSNYVYIRNGSTVTMDGGRSTTGITVEAGGTLIGAAAGATSTLKVGVGATVLQVHSIMVL